MIPSANDRFPRLKSEKSWISTESSLPRGRLDQNRRVVRILRRNVVRA